MARPALSALMLGPLALLLLGFGLDRGELGCEQATAHLAECCPGFPVERVGCIQEGGCEREAEGTLLTLAESECLIATSCEEIRADQRCERLLERLDALEDLEGPSLAQLHAGDPLCE